MEKFLYVFDEQTRDKLLSLGFEMLGDALYNKAHVYVFVNKSVENFSLSSVNVLPTNRLTFDFPATQ